MNTTLHRLTGCAPTPLALYLKALGILRIVSKHDPNARGWWQDERFCLLCNLDENELRQFFLNDYSPTPIFNPWGARSGFYAGGSESTARLALQMIENSDSTRLSGFRKTIAIIRQEVERFGGEKPDKKDEYEFVQAIRRKVRDGSEKWLGTVMVSIGDQCLKPPIFGSGGNEGSGGYASAYLAAVTECIVRREADSQLDAALYDLSFCPTITWDGGFGAATKPGSEKTVKKSVNGPFRQFLPEGDGTAWGLLLAFEGALVIQSSVVRRSTITRAKVSSPFYFEPHGVGTPTSCDSDEFVMNKGKRLPGRGEQWFPIWHRPTRYLEVESLFLEGRCSNSRRSAQDPIDAARAVTRLGVTLGITEFLRYGYFQRNNLATHFAVPLGSVRVRENPRSNLVDDLAGWMNKLQRLARDNHAPARLVQVERRLADAVFAALTHDDTPQRWRAVLDAAVDVEVLQAGGTAITAGPIPKLRPDWVAAIHDGSCEVRLARSLAGAAAQSSGHDPVRHHWLPLESPWANRFQVSDKRLANDPRVVAKGRDAVADCAAVVERRLIDAEQDNQRRLPLKSAIGCHARLTDIAELIDGHVDLERVVKLARALMALDWPAWRRDYRELLPAQPPESVYENHPDEAWLAVKLACLPCPIAKGLDIPVEPSIVRRLIAGDAASAVQAASRRLGACGLRLPFSGAIADADTARLWAAALVFPVSQASARRAANILVPDYFGENNA
ncbi:hypothetical protein K227x_42640 [Rubripirellula lacrimiformis]|uniref:Type I-U CRISPR-associated protein Csx17 n=1 Tax=Rubripirellula lacrimiformis TaxID=1930273 RepID=A0A517NFE5_9BACT|nr:type I-U CRISPR-associated protein Csx17 [Rubripirellula lacrimiformis]QDT05859.1 hypothetical protein K227x_42640 [Rubripirellula lacrimiformis]